ncbi:MAG TPA: maleylpyruvate isomerase family mycothiol-dependent enzyme [Mycobacteriales bacterium]|nr:maleylpyruvate isomerase family mycothiol-dependent enzyme [Mycobacteriales bacterium]
MDSLGPAEMLAQLAADGAALRAAATDLDADVPTCPGWTVRDAVEHTAMVYAHKSQIIENDVLDNEGEWPPPGLDPSDTLEFFDEQLHRVIEALRTRDPSTHVFSWYEPDQTVGFWVRRMMQETVIHRADVESAYGAPSPVDDLVAVDGIDELLVCFLAYDVDGYLRAAGSGEHISVRAGDRVWTVTLGAERATVAHDAATDADVSISGAPSDVLLALWNRAPYDVLRTSGDPAALTALRSAVVATTQ